MKNMIKENLDKPELLEKLYREDSELFAAEFNSVYPDISQNLLAKAWHERLSFDQEAAAPVRRKDLFLLMLGIIIAATIAKLPEIFSLDPEFFYPRNSGFIVFPLLTAYFAWKSRLPVFPKIFIALTTLLCILFINLAFNQDIRNTQTLLLSCIHIPLVLWALLGVAYTGGEDPGGDRRLSYLRYNGDFIVMISVILLASIIFAAISFQLFRMIGWDADKIFSQYILICGLAASPIVATFVIETNNQVVSKVSPVIARIFSPLALITVFIYLLAMISKGSDPFLDRNFLIVFNLLLIGVMAIILFSVAEASRSPKRRIEKTVLFLLSTVTVAVNCIALSAILFRINEWGITPNKAAVLGANILFLINLLIISFRLFQSLRKGAGLETVSESISRFLPVYAVWAIIVAFVFPFVFSFD
jgi:hypothetical protein